MPLAEQGMGVLGLVEQLRQGRLAQRQGRTDTPDPGPEPIAPGHHRRPRGGAGGACIGVAEEDAVRGELVEVRRGSGGGAFLVHPHRIYLINRKVAREKGVSAKAQIATMRELLDSLAGAGSEDLSAIGDVLSKGIDALEGATDWIVATHARDTEAIAAGAVPYLRLMGVVSLAAAFSRRPSRS